VLDLFNMVYLFVSEVYPPGRAAATTRFDSMLLRAHGMPTFKASLIQERNKLCVNKL